MNRICKSFDCDEEITSDEPNEQYCDECTAFDISCELQDEEARRSLDND